MHIQEVTADVPVHVESPAVSTSSSKGVRNWSQIAASSVNAAVVTASDNKHTTANR